MLAAIVEKRVPYRRNVTIDLFGFIDILALDGSKTIGIQTTSGSNINARINKIKACPKAHEWLESPHRMVVVHGWRKLKPRGQKVAKWTLREEWIGLADLDPLPPPDAAALAGKGGA